MEDPTNINAMGRALEHVLSVATNCEENRQKILQEKETVEARNAVALSKLNTTKIRMDNLESDNSRLTNEIKTQMAKLSKKSEIITILSNTVEKLQNDVSAKDDEILKKEQLSNESSRNFQEKITILEERLSTMADISNAKDDFQTKYESILDELRKSENFSNESFAELQAKIDSLTGELRIKDEALSAKEISLLNLRQLHDGVVEQLKSVQDTAKIDEIVVENSFQKIDNQQIALDLETVKLENSKLKENVASLQARLSEALNFRTPPRSPVQPTTPVEDDPFYQLIREQSVKLNESESNLRSTERKLTFAKLENDKLRAENVNLKQKLCLISSSGVVISSKPIESSIKMQPSASLRPTNDKDDMMMIAVKAELINAEASFKAKLEKLTAVATTERVDLTKSRDQAIKERDEAVAECAGYKNRNLALKENNQQLRNELKTTNDCVVLLKNKHSLLKQDYIGLKEIAMKYAIDVRNANGNAAMILIITREVEKFLNRNSHDVKAPKKDINKKQGTALEACVHRLTVENKRLETENGRLKAKNVFIEKEKERTVEILQEEVRKALSAFSKNM